MSFGISWPALKALQTLTQKCLAIEPRRGQVLGNASLRGCKRSFEVTRARPDLVKKCGAVLASRGGRRRGECRSSVRGSETTLGLLLAGRDRPAVEVLGKVRPEVHGDAAIGGLLAAGSYGFLNPDDCFPAINDAK
jgi:hypothetical protein